MATQNIAAGLLMYRIESGRHEFFLVHPGGPYFAKKDAGHWSIPKGIPEDGEKLLETAQREFHEETGIRAAAPFYELGTVKQKGGKLVHAWAFKGTWNPEDGITCNTFTLEWPPRSGKKVQVPEVDKAGWFDYDSATRIIIAEQVPLLERAVRIAAT